MDTSSHSDPVRIYHDRFTMAGVISHYWPELVKTYKWNSDTCTRYRKYYFTYIIPALPGHDHRSIDMLTQEDFQACIRKIQAQGYQMYGDRQAYEALTIEKFWYLIRIVVETAASHYLCRNFILADQRQKSRKPKDERAILSRSFTPGQQVLAEKLLLSDPLQTGERMGLGCMLSLGLRDNEACGLDYGDIRQMDGNNGIFFAWIYKSVKLGSNELKASGKTHNADRLIPIYDPKLLKLIMDRRAYLEAQGLSTEHLPIACRGSHYTVRCSSDDLTNEAHTLFAELSVSFEQMDAIRTLIDEAHSTGASIYGPEVIEKSLTAYFLRRNAATLYSHFLTLPELCYVIGHDIEGPETRNEFMCDAALLQIWSKLSALKSRSASSLRPSLASSARISGTSIDIELPADCTRAQLLVSAYEPLESIRIAITNTAPEDLAQEIVVYQNHCSYSSTVDIYQDYRKLLTSSDSE